MVFHERKTQSEGQENMFHKGDLLQVGTSPVVYQVIRDETKTGYVTCIVAGDDTRQFRFNSRKQELNDANRLKDQQS